tara:strand:- start:2215 stop:2469 length:255 start_codon:yes stop_codon:yes gene_type:complete
MRVKKKRNYKREYRLFHKNKKAKKARAGRNFRRRRAERDGRVSKGDGKDLHHYTVGGKTMTRIESASVNRGRSEASRRPGSSRK